MASGVGSAMMREVKARRASARTKKCVVVSCILIFFVSGLDLLSFVWYFLVGRKNGRI